MPKKRWIKWSGEQWSLSDLAREHGVSRGTLKYRIDVIGMPISRALATGIQTRQEAGKRGADASNWRGHGFIYKS